MAPSLRLAHRSPTPIMAVPRNKHSEIRMPVPRITSTSNFYIDGKRYQLSTATCNRRLTEQIAQKRKQIAPKYSRVLPTPDMTVGQVTTRFIAGGDASVNSIPLGIRARSIDQRTVISLPVIQQTPNPAGSLS